MGCRGGWSRKGTNKETTKGGEEIHCTCNSTHVNQSVNQSIHQSINHDHHQWSLSLVLTREEGVVKRRVVVKEINSDREWLKITIHAALSCSWYVSAHTPLIIIIIVTCHLSLISLYTCSVAHHHHHHLSLSCYINCHSRIFFFAHHSM